MLVPKKDGSLRLCIDYRRLNKVTTQDPYPMPRIDDLLDGLGSAHFISTLDLSKGYWQVPVAADSRQKTAFVTPLGKYQFKVMPFGLVGAPAVFQRMMNTLLADIISYAGAYIDDLVIFSTSWDDHLNHLRTVFQKLRAAKLTAKPQKCQFGMFQCSYLGHLVGQGRVKPEDAKISAIRSFLQPQTKKDVRSFLGLAGYYRRFIPEFATIASPLTDLTRKDAPEKVSWQPAHQHAFDQLKCSLSSETVLASPNFDRPFFLQTDASNVGVGAKQMTQDTTSLWPTSAANFIPVRPDTTRVSCGGRGHTTLQYIPHWHPVHGVHRPQVPAVLGQDERREWTTHQMESPPPAVRLYRHSSCRNQQRKRRWALPTGMGHSYRRFAPREGGRSVRDFPLTEPADAGYLPQTIFGHIRTADSS